jgi:hypothetical protein
MSLIHFTLIVVVLFIQPLIGQNERTFKITTIAFYNLENLFDIENDPMTFDDDRTPEGKDHWTKEIYEAKLKNMAKVISEIGRSVTGTSPTIIGVSEIENRMVLDDLVNQKLLVQNDYGIIHIDSPDRRGIDVALLYLKKIFIPTHYVAYPLYIYQDKDPDKRIYTRDQLLVSGMLDGEKIHIIINHWPSRSGGEARSRPKRIKAAELNRRIIDSLFSLDPYAKIISMGDFNDDPVSRSIKDILSTKDTPEEVGIKEMFNPMEKLYFKGLGTLAWRDSWNLFDQIIISDELLKKEFSSYRYYKVGIYNKSYLANVQGKYKGYPYRSFSDGKFTGGYSDHFPVYIFLIKQIK